MKYIGVWIAIWAGLTSAYATDLDTDRKAIESMAGCYVVDFNFIETHAPQDGYQLKDPYHATALEYIALDDASNANEVILQHLLIMGERPPLKHWRQVWKYESSYEVAYQGLSVQDRVHQWKKQLLPPANDQWTQKVYGVADEPRYQCSSKWVHTQRDASWSCQSWAPLPRRDYSKRSDYQVLNRLNTHIVTPVGWTHRQHNQKIQLEGGAPKVLVEEVGVNPYVKVETSRCEQAAQWWEANKETWHIIQKAWEAVYQQNQTLLLKHQVDEQEIWMPLYQLAGDSAELSEDEVFAGALRIIQTYQP